MKYFSILLLAASRLLATEAEFFDVFKSKTEGYAQIRIPAVVVTRAGSVLAFAEGRQKPSDQAENDIVMKRSTDGGKTWSPLKVLHDDGAHSLNNPTVVQEQQSGRIFLWYQRIPSHLREHDAKIATGLEGQDIYRNFILTSDDDGVTWAAPQDVTATTKRPQRATTVASGPGIGIQLTRGEHKGRLIIPFNEGPYGKWQNYAVFSDDAGKTWTYGDDVPGALVPDGKGGERSQINEVQMAELPDGSVLLDSRQFAGAKVRKASVSKDGGKTWSSVQDVPALTDPSCMASTIRHLFPEGTFTGMMVHSGPDATKRERGTVWLSSDDGKSWPVKRLLYPGAFAYSVLCSFPDGTLGCLFEADNYGRIVFARLPVGWALEEVKTAGPVTLSRQDHWLVIQAPSVPGKEIKINYLEAYCRGGSTDADWVKHTTVGHVTESLPDSGDGKQAKLRCKVNDGLVVEHDIRAVEDGVTFDLTVTNPTDHANEAQWAQPCIRLGDFAGAETNDPNCQDIKLDRAFIFLDGKLTTMPTRPWATEARYKPGQVWCPKDVPRTDVNPRPLSTLVPDNGVIGCFSSDSKWIFAVCFDPTQELFQGVGRCLHNDFRIGNVAPGGTKKIRGRIWIIANDPARLIKLHAEWLKGSSSK